ncbi:hypothetical protein JM81_0211 [Maribacter sp. MAR_2009_72]|nr:hypothetical protein JM81_0211 [Maribacter sp. MAR_2009_72]
MCLTFKKTLTNMKFTTKNWFPLFRLLIVMWTGTCIFGLIIMFFISPADFIDYSFNSAHDPKEAKKAVNMCIFSITIGFPISVKILKEITED